jgi:trehalose 6-phosphate synthase/phosphatase
LIINPNDLEEIATALKEALEMPVEEKMRRNRIMRSRIKRHDVTQWANGFVQALLDIKDEDRRRDYKQLTLISRSKLKDDFFKAGKRLFLLDYDGTLADFAGSPHLAPPSEEIRKILHSIADNPENDLVLVSGRDKATLQTWFGSLNIGLVAEHGVWIRKKNEEWRMLKQITSDWKPKILPILDLYSDRLPGSFVEDKEFSLAWHYRMAENEMASVVAKELLDDLVNFTSNISVQILKGDRVIEVRNPGLNKGDAGSYWISEKEYDFILAIGDDSTDEDLFKILPETAYSIKVGTTQSQARFSLPHVKDVIDLLKEMAA